MAEIVPAYHRIDAEIKSVNVRVGQPQERTGAIDITLFEKGTGQQSGAGTSIAIEWKSALQDALDRKLLFKDNMPKTLTVSVVILKFTAPSFSLTRFTEVEAKYQITDRTTGDMVWERTVYSDGHSGVGEAALGTTGFRYSINRAVQANIGDFLDALEDSFRLAPASLNNKK